MTEQGSTFINIEVDKQQDLVDEQLYLYIVQIYK